MAVFYWKTLFTKKYMLWDAHPWRREWKYLTQHNLCAIQKL